MEFTVPRVVTAAELIVGETYLIRSLEPGFDDYIGTFNEFTLRSYYTFTNISKRQNEKATYIIYMSPRSLLTIPIERLNKVEFIHG